MTADPRISGDMPHPRPVLLLTALLFAASAPLAAQLPPLTAPKGMVRLEFGGRFDNWDKMYFAGAKNDAAGDFIRDPASGAWLPSLGEVERRLKAITGAVSVSLSLGKTSAHELVNVGTESIGAAYGLTSRLTVFGNIPYVRVRVQNRVTLDSTHATAGFNPPTGDVGSSFLGLFNSALISLQDKIATPGQIDPAQLPLAQATLARGTALRDSLIAFFGTSKFVPLQGGPAAAAINGSIDSIRTRLNGFNIPLVAVLAFPTAGAPHDAIESIATDPNGPIKAQPFEPPILRYIGDIEIGAAFAWLDRRPKNGGLLVRSALQGTVRLRTGKLGRPDGLFDVGTGERQPDVQGDLVTDLAAGHFGARVTARYVLQLPGRQDRRITPPDQPLADASTLATVERDPGEIVEGVLEPWVRIASHFSIVGGIRHWMKGADKYTYVPNQDPIPGTTPDVLAIGSKENGTVLSAALSLVHDGVRKDGTRGAPLEAVLRGEWVVGSSEGRVPVKQTLSFQLRVFHKLF